VVGQPISSSRKLQRPPPPGSATTTSKRRRSQPGQGAADQGPARRPAPLSRRRFGPLAALQHFPGQVGTCSSGAPGRLRAFRPGPAKDLILQSAPAAARLPKRGSMVRSRRPGLPGPAPAPLSQPSEAPSPETWPSGCPGGGAEFSGLGLAWSLAAPGPGLPLRPLAGVARCGSVKADSPGPPAPPRPATWLLGSPQLPTCLEQLKLLTETGGPAGAAPLPAAAFATSPARADDPLLTIDRSSSRDPQSPAFERELRAIAAPGARLWRCSVLRLLAGPADRREPRPSGIRRGARFPDPARRGESGSWNLPACSTTRRSTWPRSLPPVDRRPGPPPRTVGDSSNNLRPQGTAPPRRSALRQEPRPWSVSLKRETYATRQPAFDSGPSPCWKSETPAEKALTGSQLNGTQRTGSSPINHPLQQHVDCSSCSSLVAWRLG